MRSNMNSPRDDINFYHNVPEWNEPIINGVEVRNETNTKFSKFKNWLNGYGMYYLLVIFVVLVALVGVIVSFINSQNIEDLLIGVFSCITFGVIFITLILRIIEI